MANVDFGQIPFELICRFGEISKTEIIVLSYLYACRNTDSKQCNPGRKLISADTGIAKTHLSTALSSLERFGWLLEDENGYFTLIANPPKKEKVTESVTNKKKVTKSVTKVTESVTEVTKSVTGLNKDLEQRKNRERTEKKPKSVSDKPKRVDSPELISFRKTLSSFQDSYAKPTTDKLAIAQNNAIRKLFDLSSGNAVSCIERHRYYQNQPWREGRVDWCLVVREFNYYGKNNGSNQTNSIGYQRQTKPTNADVLATSADFYANYPS